MYEPWWITALPFKKKLLVQSDELGHIYDRPSLGSPYQWTCRVLHTFLSSPRPLLLLQPFQLIASQELTFGCFMWAQPSCLFLLLSRHSVSLEFVVCPCLCSLRNFDFSVHALFSFGDFGFFFSSVLCLKLSNFGSSFFTFFWVAWVVQWIHCSSNFPQGDWSISRIPFWLLC